MPFSTAMCPASLMISVTLSLPDEDAPRNPPMAPSSCPRSKPEMRTSSKFRSMLPLMARMTCSEERLQWACGAHVEIEISVSFDLIESLDSIRARDRLNLRQRGVGSTHREIH